MRVLIETVPHSSHRYATVGDFFEDTDGTLHIRVSDMGNKKYETLVAIHELVEAVLCGDRGITDEQITAFDMEFEKNRKDVSEPGDDPKAPYARQHCFATAIERMMCAELGINWFDYEQAVRKL